MRNWLPSGPVVMVMVSGGPGRTNQNAIQIAARPSRTAGPSDTARSRQEILEMFSGQWMRPDLRCSSCSIAAFYRRFYPAMRSRIEDGADDHGRIQANPPDTRQIDVFIALLQPVPEPEDGGKQISAPRNYGNAGGLMADPDGPYLRNRHQHGEDRHAAQDATKNRIGERSMAGGSCGVLGHRRLLLAKNGVGVIFTARVSLIKNDSD